MGFAKECEGRRYQLERPERTVWGRAVGGPAVYGGEFEGKGRLRRES